IFRAPSTAMARGSSRSPGSQETRHWRSKHASWTWPRWSTIPAWAMLSPSCDGFKTPGVVDPVAVTRGRVGGMTMRGLAPLGAGARGVARAMLGPGGSGAPAVRAVTPDGAAGAAGQVDDAVVVRITSPPPGQPVLGRVDIAGFAADPRGPRGT